MISEGKRDLPATQVGPFVNVPLTAGAVESTIVVPLFSFIPQRPIKPVPLGQLRNLYWLGSQSRAERGSRSRLINRARKETVRRAVR